MAQEQREAGSRGGGSAQSEADVAVARLVAGIFARVAAEDKGALIVFLLCCPSEVANGSGPHAWTTHHSTT